MTQSGYIVNNIYPYLLGKKVDVEAESFFKKQPSNVRSLLKWESRKYASASPEVDPLPREFITTRHPNIFYSYPKLKATRKKQPIFFCCAHCNGRAFWDLPVCGWCGKDILMGITANATNNTYISLVDYLYPQTIRPPITEILAKIVDEDSIDPYEISQELKTITKYIPASYSKNDISFGRSNNKWSILIEGSAVPLEDIGIPNKKGFANLYYLRSSKISDYKKYFLSEALAKPFSKNREIGIKKLPLKELTTDPNAKVLTLVPKNKSLNLGIVIE